MTSVAVIQPKPGIGDLVWHLPFIRAIAATSPGGTVTLLIPPRSHAQELLVEEPSIERTIYFEHHGSELARGVHLVRLIVTLRRLDCETIWILDRTTRPALAAMLARIPRRISYGLGRQRWFITNPGLDRNLNHAHPLDWIKALMTVMNVSCTVTQPSLRLPAETIAAVGLRYRAHPRPWTVLGLGASSPIKDWPLPHWTELVGRLRRRSVGTVFLIGGPDHRARAAGLIEHTAGAPLVNACDLKVVEAAALLSLSDLFVGPDSGPLNLAAAVGIRSFGLFGATDVLTNSKLIHAILPDDGHPFGPDGMQRISPAAVLNCIAPYLARSGSIS